MSLRKTKALTAEAIGLINNPHQQIPVISTEKVDITQLAKLNAEILSDQTIEFNEAKASEYIDLPIFAGEREVISGHVQELFDEMTRNRFNWLLVILSTAIYNGIVYKINGQHTAWAMLYLQQVMPNFKVQVREIKYRVKTLEQLKVLYSTYDRIKPRSDAHLQKIFLIGTEAAQDLWPSILTAVCAGFKFWHFPTDAQYRRLSVDDVNNVIKSQYAQLFRTVGLFVQERHKNKLLRQPVKAAMFATFDKVPTKAPDFWVPVLEGTGLMDKTDPRWHLRELLQRATTRAASARDRGARLVTDEEVYRISLSAWNKWRKDESCQAALRAPTTRPKPV